MRDQRTIPIIRRAAAFATSLILLFGPTGAAASEALCHVEIISASEALQRSHEALIKTCLKKQSACPFTTHAVEASENALRNQITGPGGACDQAVNVDGVPLSNFGPGAVCRDAGGSTSCEEAIPSISTLDDLANCLVCLQRSLMEETTERIAAFNRFMDSNKARCIRSLFTAASKSARAGRREVARCAVGGTQPFACPVDDAPDGKLGKSLAKIETRVAKCKDEAGIAGQLSAQTMNDLCRDGPHATNADVANCYADSVRCTTCLYSNRVLGQAQDCPAFSGVACQGTVVEPGMLYVANSGDDTVTFYDAAGGPINGTVAASSFAAGVGVRGLAAHPHSNILYVANADDDTVTFLDAKTGVPAFGTLAASTFPVGDGPIALDVPPTGWPEALFVLNAGDETVTILHSWTGKPWNGDLVSSTFAVGADPRDISAAGVVLVTNHGDDTVTALASDGTGYRNGSFASSTYPVGDGPTLITRISETFIASGLFVVNANDATITRVDINTGIPAATTPAAGAPIGIAAGGSIPGVLRPVWTTTGGGDLVVYNPDGSFLMTDEANATFPITGAPTTALFDSRAGSVHVLLTATDEVATFPTDLASGSSVARPCHLLGEPVRDMALDTVNDRLYLLCNGGRAIVALDATAPGYAFGSAAASTFAIAMSARMREIEVDGSAGIIYASASDDTLDTLEVLQIDATTGALLGASPVVVGTFVLGGFTTNVALALDSTLGLLYLADRDNNAVIYLDAATLGYLGGTAVGATLPMGVTPTKLAADGGSGAVYGITLGTDSLVYADSASVNYLGPDLAGSTLATVADPLTIVANPATGLAYVTSAVDDVVTFFDGASVAYAFGSFGASTFAVDSGGQITVDPVTNRLYVGSSISFAQTVTILDAATGAYVNGTLAQSVYPWLTTAGMVANPNNGLVIAAVGQGLSSYDVFYYDGLTGAPAVWGPSITTRSTGPSPVAVEAMRSP